MAGATTRKFKVEGLPSDVTKSRLITFFRNEQSQGGGPVEDVIILEDKSKAIIIFKEPEAVQMIIGRRDTVSISNTTVKVRPYYEKAVNDCESAQTDLTKKMMLTAMEKTETSFLKKHFIRQQKTVAIHNRTPDLDSSNNKEAGSVEDNYEKEKIRTKKDESQSQTSRSGFGWPHLASLHIGGSQQY